MTDTITIRVRLAEAAKFAGEAHIVSAEIDEIGDSAERANKKSRGAAGGMNILQKSTKFLTSKAGLLTVGLGLIVQALSAATTGTVAFVSALAPLGGLLGALPAGMLIAAQGAGVLKLAFHGVGGAVGGLNQQLNPKKFAALTAPAQGFALVLDSLKKPIIDLQKRVQGGLFPGLTAGLKAAKPVLQALAGPLTGTAKVFGSLGDRLGHLVGSKGFLTDLRQQANFNNVQLNRLGGAGLHVVDILRQITVASRPLVNWLVKLASGWAATADKTAIADRHNGKLAATFRTIQRVTGSVFKIIGNLGKAFFNVGKIGQKNLGESLLQSLVKGSDALKKWTESGPGISKITKFFAEAKPTVYAFAKLIGALVVDFLKLGTGGANGGLTTLFNKLRTETLPLVLKVTEGLTKLFGIIAKDVPGGTWLLGIGFLLAKLGGGGLIGGIANGFGRQFGIRMAGGLAGETAAFSAAGSSLGLVFAGGLLAAVLGYEVGKKISEALPNGLLGKPEAKPTQTNNAIMGLNKGTYVENGIIKPKRGFPNTHIGGKPASHGSTVRVYDRLLHHYVNVRPGETLPGPPHHSAPSHGPTLKAPTTTEVHRSGGTTGGSDTPIHIHSHTTLQLNDKPIAEGTNEVSARLKALA
jgi:hypothetical protein